MNGAPQSAMLSVITELVLDKKLILTEYCPTVFGSTSIGASGGNDQLKIDGDADFLLYAIHGVAYTAAATFVQFPNLTVDIKNSGSGRYFSQNPMHWCTIVGNSQYPFFLPEPMILPRTSNLLITLANASGTTFTTLNMTFLGQKLFPQGDFSLNQLMAPSSGFNYTR